MPTTRTVDSNSSTDVMAKIALSSPGDTVQLLATSATWAANSVSFSGITLNGISPTSPVIDVTGTIGQPTVSVTKHATTVTRIQNMKFYISYRDNDSTSPIDLSGPWIGAKPIVCQNLNTEIIGGCVFKGRTAGGLIFADITHYAKWNAFFLSNVADFDTTSLTSWTTADTFGALDTTGEKNIYIERCTINGGGNGYIDASDNTRIVDRYNTFNGSGGFNSHGYDTSTYSLRHFEVYNNTYNNYFSDVGVPEYPYPYPTSAYSHNINCCIWVRGGTGLIYSNNFTGGISADSGFGDKFEMLFSIRGIQDIIVQAPDRYTCSYASYPVPQSIGQNHNGSAYFTDPIWVYNNIGTYAAWHDDFGWGNHCGFSYETFLEYGRDWLYSDTQKPGYTAYTYPHPLTLTTDDSLRGRSLPSIFL
jgi:hypothetical protein